MTHDELWEVIDIAKCENVENALRAVVELIQEKQKFLENTKGAQRQRSFQSVQ